MIELDFRASSSHFILLISFLVVQNIAWYVSLSLSMSIRRRKYSACEFFFSLSFSQAKLILGGLSLCQSVKVPFILLPPLNPDDPDPYPGVMTTQINFDPEDVITTTACSTTPQKTATGTSPMPPSPTSQLVDVSSNTKTVENSSSGMRRVQQQDDDDEDGCETTLMKRGVSVAQVVTTTSTSSSTTISAAQHYLQHQPQIHHHHLASSPATTPSPVRVPSVEHLFWKEKSFNDTDSITHLIPTSFPKVIFSIRLQYYRYQCWR